MGTCLKEDVGCVTRSAAESMGHGVEELTAMLQKSGPSLSMSVKKAAVRSVGSGDPGESPAGHQSLEELYIRFHEWQWQWIETGLHWLADRALQFYMWIVISICILLVIALLWRWQHIFAAAWQRARQKLGWTHEQPEHCRGFTHVPASLDHSACSKHCVDHEAYKKDLIVQAGVQYRIRMLTMAVVGSACLMVATVIVGRRIGSLALIGDGIHLSGDVATYGALLAAEMVTSSWRTNMETFSYGYARLEVLFVFVALSGQYYAASLLAWSAVDRLRHPYELPEDSGAVIFSLGLAALIVNAGLGTWMHFCGINCCQAAGEAGAAAACAKIHLLCDAVQNTIVIITGSVIWSAPHLSTLEPICTLIFVLLLIYSTSGFWIMMLDILMERTPRHVDTTAIYDDLDKIEGVEEVHCLHVWALAPGKVAATVHLCTEDCSSNAEVLRQAQCILKDRYSIKHSTVQVSESDDIM